MAPIKIAILGAGFISEIHCESYHRFVPNAEVVAVYTRNAEKAQSFAQKHGIAQWYNDLDAIIQSSGADVIDICLPNFLHAESTMKAAAAKSVAFTSHLRNRRNKLSGTCFPSALICKRILTMACSR